MLYNDYNIPPLQQNIESIISEVKTSQFLTAKIDDLIIGSVRARMDNNICKIGRLIVHPKY